MPRRKRSRTRSANLSDDSDFEIDVECLSDSETSSPSRSSTSSPVLKRSTFPSHSRKCKGQRRTSRRQSSSQPDASEGLHHANTESSTSDSDGLLTCSECGVKGLPSCVGSSPQQNNSARCYPWQCLHCKTCSYCHKSGDKKHLLLCDECDRGYHMFCLEPKLEEPPSGSWSCEECSSHLEESPAQLTAKPAVPDSETHADSSGPRKWRHRGKTTVNPPTPGVHEEEEMAAVSSDVASDATPKNRKSCNPPIIRRIKASFFHKKCPTPGCDGQGHATKKYEMHHTVSGCPLYNSMTPVQRKELFKHKKEQEGKEKKSKSYTPRSTAAAVGDSPNKALRSQIQLSLMPEKIRAAVTRKEITPDRCSTPTERPDSSHSVSKSWAEQPDSESSSVSTEQLDEESLKGLTAEADLKLFKDAWAKAVEANEEELMPISSYPNSRRVKFGCYEMEAWYSSPFPEEFWRLKKIYICEFCLKYMKSATVLRRHMAKCGWKHPQGTEIYRKNNISIFEVDGKNEKVYCQNLCLLAKLFLDHKTLYYDVEPFLFYVMTRADSSGCHLVGYFSKEKKSFLNYNVSCILTLPPYMRQGYGKMLIDFSYLLSKVEGKVGSPEKPLSDLGLLSYRSYWKEILLKYLVSYEPERISIKDMSQDSALHPSDIISTLQYLGILKYWKGKHVILRSQELTEEFTKKMSLRSPDYQEIDPSCLQWTPPVFEEAKG